MIVHTLERSSLYGVHGDLVEARELDGVAGHLAKVDVDVAGEDGRVGAAELGGWRGLHLQDLQEV